MSLKRLFSTSQIKNKIVPSNLKGKKSSSQQWLTRQINDPYVAKAKILNYRCRSAFKLLEIHDKYDILRPGSTVIDCGAAPGSWTQVAVDKVNSNGNTGLVIAVDRLQIYPIKGAVILGSSDFTSSETRERIKQALNGKSVDIVLSDMAPNATGIKSMDDENMLSLCYAALRFAIENSKPDATFLFKLWQCGELKRIEGDVSRFYEDVRIVKPKASRSDSAEIYFLCRNFKGLKNN